MKTIYICYSPSRQELSKTPCLRTPNRRPKVHTSRYWAPPLLGRSQAAAPRADLAAALPAHNALGATAQTSTVQIVLVDELRRRVAQVPVATCENEHQWRKDGELRTGAPKVPALGHGLAYARTPPVWRDDALSRKLV